MSRSIKITSMVTTCKQISISMYFMCRCVFKQLVDFFHRKSYSLFNRASTLFTVHSFLFLLFINQSHLKNVPHLATGSTTPPHWDQSFCLVLAKSCSKNFPKLPFCSDSPGALELSVSINNRAGVTGNDDERDEGEASSDTGAGHISVSEIKLLQSIRVKTKCLEF